MGTIMTVTSTVDHRYCMNKSKDQLASMVVQAYADNAKMEGIGTRGRQALVVDCINRCNVAEGTAISKEQFEMARQIILGAVQALPAVNP